MDEAALREIPVEGKSYSLFGSDSSTKRYYAAVRDLINDLLEQFPDEQTLLLYLRKASGYTAGRNSPVTFDRHLRDLLIGTVGKRLSEYTQNTKQHLRSLSFRKRFDPVIRTKEHQYHLYMLEIELANRMYKQQFKDRAYRFALIAHCLRDFRPSCKSVPGDMEQVCMACTKDCYIHLGGMLLKKCGIHPYISMTIDMEQLFRKLKSEHPDIGALGIACVPELVHGMRLCHEIGIPAVGIPLSANRCARWMEKARESSFSLTELEELIL